MCKKYGFMNLYRRKIRRAILIDLDGTLVNTQEANYNAYRRALLKYSYDLSPEIFNKTFGEDSRVFLPRLAPHLNDEELSDVRFLKSRFYREELSRTSLNTDLYHFLKSLRHNHKLGLVTTAKKINVESILEFHKLTGFFDLIITGDDVLTSKPAPDPYQLAIKLLSVTPEKAYVFEDSDVGVKSALNAGLRVIKIQYE